MRVSNPFITQPTRDISSDVADNPHVGSNLGDMSCRADMSARHFQYSRRLFPAVASCHECISLGGFIMVVSPIPSPPPPGPPPGGAPPSANPRGSNDGESLRQSRSGITRIADPPGSGSGSEGVSGIGQGSPFGERMTGGLGTPRVTRSSASGLRQDPTDRGASPGPAPASGSGRALQVRWLFQGLGVLLPGKGGQQWKGRSLCHRRA